ncbi:MAG TPA: acylphosphatase [Candidatus Polarisedimenticolaceae bacterium]|nr:acylphosphatase [Candidatus Polarisedimenticolaceae bacterium]
MTRIRLVVHGTVQGVGFRYAAREAASQCGVLGWVRNRADGSVEIVVQGSAASVARMTAWAESGPAYADVLRVDVAREDAAPDLEGFEIRR